MGMISLPNNRKYEVLSRQDEFDALKAIEDLDIKLIRHIFKNNDELILKSFQKMSADDKIMNKYITFKSFSENDLKVIRIQTKFRKWLRKIIKSFGNGNSSWSKTLMKIHTENQNRKNDFASRNLKLVLMSVNRFKSRVLPETLNDLIQDGMVGLFKAIDKFSVDQNVRFATYAIWWIKSSLKRSYEFTEPIVSIPSYVSDASLMLKRANSENAENDILVGRFAKSDESVKDIVRFGKPKMVWIDDENVDGQNSWHDTYSVTQDQDDLGVSNMDESTVHSFLSYLTPVESTVIKHMCGLLGSKEMTLQMLGDIFGLSRERIRQVKEAALKKLRRVYKNSQRNGLNLRIPNIGYFRDL